jgi:hypothetical protein
MDMNDYVGEFLNDVGAGNVRNAVSKLQASPNAMAKGLVHLAKAVKANQNAMRNERIDNASKAGDLPQIFLPLDSSTTIAASIADTVKGEPTSRVRITDLFIDPRDADDFLVSGIKVGRLDHLVGSGSIPAGSFSSGNQRPPIATPILASGTPAQLSVTNRGGAARRFVGFFTAIDLDFKSN